MPIPFAGHGVRDYSKFGAGAAVLVRVEDRLDPSTPGVPVVHAGRLRDAFAPGQALLMRPGTFAVDLAFRHATLVTHLITERRFAHEPPDGVQVASRAPDGPARSSIVMIDREGIVGLIEAKPLVWPEHLEIAARIENAFERAIQDHAECLTSLLYR